MCFNSTVSMITFLLGTVGCLLLVKYGNPVYKNENVIFAIFLFFISLIQLMDYFFWIDLHNTIGINKITTIIGPLLNVGQPIILYLIKLYFYQPNIVSFKNYNLEFLLLNTAYFINLIFNYFIFISKDSLITSTKHGHLNWSWIKYYNPLFYLIMLALNIFYLTNFKYSLSLFVVTYLFLFLSYKFFYYNAGELWCFFGSFISFIILFLSYCI